MQGLVLSDLDIPALDIAIATACFCGLPAAISFFMLEETTFLLDPDFNGINHLIWNAVKIIEGVSGLVGLVSAGNAAM